MTQPPIRFDDGAAYERFMGAWSNLVGRVFLDWLVPATGQRWIDVGCGNGAFSELLMQNCAPAEIQGIDPSEGQLAYARARAGARGAIFQQGDAMELPFDAARFDIAVMALVIHFVPDPAKGVAEMARVVRPGGTVTAYVWDQTQGGSPTEPVNDELRALGITPVYPPGGDATPLDALRRLWTAAGLEGIEARAITVERNFVDFDDFWTATTGSGSLKPMLASLDAATVGQLQKKVRARLPADTQGRIAFTSRANAIKGRVPA